MNPQVSNPNDYKVVSFHNSTDFGFLPEMGCMYDGRPINGKNGSPGIDAGETVILPYHIGNQLAINLAKYVLMKDAPADNPNVPTGTPIWSPEKLTALKDTYLKELYTEDKPAQMSETDKLMEKVNEFSQFKEDILEKLGNLMPKSDQSPAESNEKTAYADKKEVIQALEARGIAHDKRKKKEELEKLLA